MSRINIIILLVLAIFFLQTQQLRFLQTTPPQSQITTIPLNTALQFNQQSSSQKYYQSTIPSPNSKQILLITVSTDIQAYVRIYVSTSNSDNFVNGTWPNWSSYTQQCFYTSLDTCALKMPDVGQLPNAQTDLLVYFTIRVAKDCTYTLDVSLQTVYPIAPNKKYSVYFNQVQSAVVELSGTFFTSQTGIQYQQMLINCIYTSYSDMGRFQLLAKQNQLPNTDYYDNTIIKSKSLNGFTQILQLPPLKSSNGSYFILLQGANSTKFNFSVVPLQSTTYATLNLNQTISYLASQQITYSYSQPFVVPDNISTNLSTIQPLVLNFYVYRGYGKFNIDYCNSKYNYTFQSIGGESGQIIITQSMRIDCYNSIQKQGELLIENLQVDIVDIMVQFGYTVGLYEGIYEGYLVPGVKQIGVLENLEQVENYDLGIYNKKSNISLTAQVFIGNVTVTVLQCSQIQQNSTKCTQIDSLQLTQTINPIDKLIFLCAQKAYCRISVAQTLPVTSQSIPSYSKYSLYLSYLQPLSDPLQPNIPRYDIVQMNQYNYYYINVSQLRLNPLYKFNNISIISIRNTVINGQTILLASTDIQQMKYDQIFKRQYNVEYGWEGSIQFIVNQTWPDCCIYIGIMGDMESIYHVQYTVNTSVNIPAAYLDMIQSTTNNYEISDDTPYLLLKYQAHIIPYTITFNPTPSCIRYGTKLPLPVNCTPSSSIPTLFTSDVVYFNITQNLVTSGSVFKFSGYVSCGGYVVQDDRPVMIACQKACYQLVKVVVENKQATIMHGGDGYVTVLDSQGKQKQQTKTSNGPLILTCSNPPCTYTLNATLRYYGQMQISFQSQFASQITWRTKPTPLPSPNQKPKLFYFQIPRYTAYTSLIFYSSAASLTVYYNIQSINQTYTNTINYQYPNPNNKSTYMQISYGDPLDNIHIVNINDQMVDQLGCQKDKMVCIVTIRVQLNESVEFSRQYVNAGLAYYSANTYQYPISPQYPILNLKQSHSLSYYTHTIKYPEQVTAYPDIIHIQPISNCRPQIQTQANNYMVNYYTDVKLKRLMPGQSIVNYRILCDDVCMYSTTITNVDYKLLWPNIQARFKVQQGSSRTVLLYQHSSYNKQINIQTNTPVSAIILGKVVYSTNDQGQPTLTIPTTVDNLAYTINTTSLIYKQAQVHQYLVVIQYSKVPKNSLSVIVRVDNHPVTLLHNQQEVYTYDPTDNSISAENNGYFEYKYYSDTNFYMFASVNKGSVAVRVRLAYLYGPQSYILNTTITNNSQPWILITATNSTIISSTDNLISYIIQCQFITAPPAGSKSTFKIHIEEDGIKGLQELYAGIVSYDAFVYYSGMNCYRFDSGMILGLDTFQVDVNFRVPIKQQFENNISNIVGMAQLYPSSYTQKITQNNTKITPTTYRLTLSYFTSSIYKICFILSNPQLIGKEYQIIINSPSMPMVYDNQYENVKRNQIYGQNGGYNMFQYVNGWSDIRNIYEKENDEEENIYYGDNSVKNVVMNVVNCMGQSILLGSQSYSDMLTGKMTTIPQSLSLASVTTALVPIPHGYYYFGVKPTLISSSAPQLFRVSIEPAPVFNSTPYIPEQYYAINWTVKSQLYTQMKNNVELVNIVVPTIVKIKGNKLSNGDGKQVIKIVYDLYLINILETRNGKLIKYQYGIDAYTKCPGLFNLKNGTNSNTISSSQFKPYQTITISNPFQASDFKPTITFTLPLTSFKVQSNISIKATVYLLSDTNLVNTINYYYGQQEILVTDQGSGTSSLWSPLKWIFLIIMTIVCMGGLSFLWRFYQTRIRRNVNFQVADMTGAQEMQARNRNPQPNQRQTQRQGEAIDTNNSRVSSNRRPLNESVGYGQFIDEVAV